MFRIVRLGLNNIMLVHYFLLTIVARQQAGAGPQHNAPATRSHGCLEFDSVLWPPRCGNEAMLSHTIRSAMRERLQASGTPPGWRYNLSTHGCTLQFDVAIGDSHACQMKVDICRQQQIIHAFRQTVQLQDGLPSTKAGYYRPFWDGMPVKHWSARNGTARASPCSNAASAPRDCTLQTGHNRDWLNRSPAMFTQRASKGDRSVRSEAPLFKKCAVVGGAPTLKMSGMGAQIDAHDAVFRFNDHQTNGSFRNDVGSKTTVHIMQNAQSVTKSVHKKSAEILVQIVCANANSLALAHNAASKDPATKLRILSPDFLQAFHQIFDEVGGSGPYGVLLSLMLCVEPPTLYGFSDVDTDLTLGFVHYYRDARGEKMLHSCNMPHAVLWLHVLASLGFVRFAKANNE